MIKCPTCGSLQVENTLFCRECSAYLLDDDNRKTNPISDDHLPESTYLTKELDDAADSNDIQNPYRIRLKIENHREINLLLDKAVHIGRLDPISNVFPEIDLTEDGGVEKGVSRRHARIIRHNDVILLQDLDSTNGTFINDEKVAPYLSETLTNGDKLRLGRLSIEVEFLKD